MKPREQVAALAAVVLGLSLALAACSSQGTSGTTPTNAVAGSRITVAMVTHGQAFDPFWALVKKGAQQAASDFNVALTYQSPTEFEARLRPAAKDPGDVGTTALGGRV